MKVKQSTRLIPLLSLILLLIVAAPPSFAEKAEVRSVTGGQVQGKLVSNWGRKPDLAVYKGIPYAAPPVGEYRWQPPQAVTPWQGVKTTEDYGPICPQTTELLEVINTMIDGEGMSWWRTKLLKFLIGFAPERVHSEDCLTINVWTQKGASREELKPVMVWVHGGGHIAGSASDGIYEGDVLARKDVVLVTFNYRLGILGYMAHPQLSQEAEKLTGVRSSGNYGTLDQVAALQWVQDNIAEFGGDPNKVTIFGESAGGHSVGQLMATPLARGLFHRAIAQSGLGTHNYLHLTKDMPGSSAAENSGVTIAEEAGIAGDADDVVTQLRELSVEQLLAIGSKRLDLVDLMHPNVDGWLLEKPVASVFAAGEQADVPLMLGSNADEGTLFSIFEMAPLYWNKVLPNTTDELQALLSEEFGDADARLLMAHYQVDSDEDVHMARLNIWGDSYFGMQALYGAEAMANVSSPAYLYFFKRTPPSPKQTIGATHGAEMSFIFGGGFPLFPKNDFDDELADTMVSYWTNFAKTGLPVAQGKEPWPHFATSKPRQMVFDSEAKAGPIERSLLYEIYARRIGAVHQQVERQLGLQVEAISSSVQ